MAGDGVGDGAGGAPPVGAGALAVAAARFAVVAAVAVAAAVAIAAAVPVTPATVHGFTGGAPAVDTASVLGLRLPPRDAPQQRRDGVHGGGRRGGARQ